MPITLLQFSPLAGPGRVGATFRDHGQRLDIRRLDLPVGGPSRNAHVPRDFDDVEGVIVMGGPQNVTDPPERVPWMGEALTFIAETHARNLPLLGVCLGHQMIAKALGGEVGPMDKPEWGMVKVTQTPPANTDAILAGTPWTSWQFQAHGQEVKTLPPGATLLQFSAACKVQAFRAGMRTYAFQYHFECDRAAIGAFVRDAGDELVRAGLTPEQALAGADERYETFGRTAERLCVNLVEYLFPVTRAITA